MYNKLSKPFQALEKHNFLGVIKSTCCSSRVTRLDSRHPHGSSNSMPTSGLCGNGPYAVYTDLHARNTYIDKKINLKKLIKHKQPQFLKVAKNFTR